MNYATLDPARQQVVREIATQRLREARKTQDLATEQLALLTKELDRRARISGLKHSVPPIFQDFNRPARYKGAHGGRGSAKSWSFGTAVLDRCVERPGSRIVCVREIQRSLEQSVKRLLEDLIQKHNLGSSFRVLNTHIETPGDGIIIFQGMQNHTAESIKSLEGYDIAWVEEAQSLSDRSLTLLRPTLRREDSELWFTWNPRNATDPIDQFLRGTVPPPNSIVKEVTYKDNPYLPRVLQDEMMWDQSRDPEKYAHVWLGQYEKHAVSRVFKNWRVEAFETPEDAMFMQGGDWGFSVDPTVLVRSFLQGTKKLYIDRERYRIGCEIDHIPMLFDTLEMDLPEGAWEQYVAGAIPPPPRGAARDWVLTSDSARPETISYLQRHGYPKVEAAVKGANSVKEGVIFLQSYDIIIHPRCIHTVDEFTMYSYKTDPNTGLVTPVLQDKKNHVIDAVRYSVERLRANIFDFKEAGMTSAATW